MILFRPKIFIPLLVVIIFVFAPYFYLVPYSGLERIVNSQLNKLLEEDLPISVEIGDIGGNLLSGIILEDVRVNDRDSSNQAETFYASHITAGYSIANLWNKKYLFDYIYIDSATIHLREDSAGNLILPVSQEKSNHESQLPLLGVDELTIRDARIVLERESDTLIIENISIVCALEVNGNTYSVNLRQAAFKSGEPKWNLSAANGRVTLSGGTLLAQELVVVSHGMRLKASGHYSPDEQKGQLQFAIDNLDFADLSSFIAPELSGVLDINGEVTFDSGVIDGTATIGGEFMIAALNNLYLKFHIEDETVAIDTLYGLILGNCSIDGNAGIDFSGEFEEYFLNANIKNFNLNNLIANSFESDLTGRINLKGSSLREATMAINVDTELRESMFDGYPIQSGSGGLYITTHSVGLPEPYRVEYFENVIHGIGHVEFDGDMQLDLDFDLKNLDRYRGKFFIDQPGGRGRAKARLSGKTNDPDISGSFVSDSVWLYGMHADSLVAEFDIKRFLGDRKGEVTITGFGGSLYATDVDSSKSRLLINSKSVAIASLNIWNDYASLYGTGRYDYEVYPQQLVLDTFELSILRRNFYNRGKLVIGADSTGFQLSRVAMGNEQSDFSAFGRMNFDESMDLLLSVNSVPVAPWLKLFAREELPIDGNLSCDAELSGSFASPAFSLYGRVDSLSYRGLILGDMVVASRFEDGKMNIDSVQITSSSGLYVATGSLHANLAFSTQQVERFPDLPLDLHITASDNKFDLVSLVLPSVEAMRGDFQADIKLGGTTNAPHLEGEAVMRDGALKYFDLVDTLYTDLATFAMTDNKIVLNNIETYVKDRKGKKKIASAMLNGDITVTAFDNFRYNISVAARGQLPFRYELDDIEGTFSGYLYVRGDTPPTVSGDLVLNDMKYYVRFAEPNEGSPLMAALAGENTWNVNVDIEFPSGYVIRNEDIDAEFSGVINLVRNKGKYRMVGEMTVLRGKAYLFDKTFRLDPGSQIFFEGGEELNPRLDIRARARIPAPPSGDDGSPSQIELAIQVTGTLDNPVFDVLDNDAGLTREDIVPLIVANYYSPEGTTTGGSLENRVSQVIGNQLGQIGTRRFSSIGVETFEIDPVYEGQVDLARTKVTLGFRTTSNLYVYGRSTLSLEGSQEVGFEYHISRLMLFEGRRDEDELHHLNLRLRWEF